MLVGLHQALPLQLFWYYIVTLIPHMFDYITYPIRSFCYVSIGRPKWWLVRAASFSRPTFITVCYFIFILSRTSKTFCIQININQLTLSPILRDILEPDISWSTMCLMNQDYVVQLWCLVLQVPHSLHPSFATRLLQVTTSYNIKINITCKFIRKISTHQVR